MGVELVIAGEVKDADSESTGKGGRPRTTSLRVHDLKCRLLQGVSDHFLRIYAVKQWGVSHSQARRYIQLAKKLICVEGKPYQDDNFLDGLVARKHLLTKAFEAGDLKLALEIMKDQSALLNQYEYKKKPASVDKSGEQLPETTQILLSPDAEKMTAKSDESK